MKQFEEVKELYDRVFRGVDGYGISFMEKQRKISDKYVKDLIYGEVPLELLYALSVLEPTRNYMSRGGIFYDLGSGIGNVVIGGYLIGGFDKYIGIELLESLYNVSLEARKKLCGISREAENSVFFKRGNILDFDLSDGDVLLFCCPNKKEEIRAEMEEKFLGLKKGAIVLSLIHVFKDSENFHPLDSRMVRTAWGQTPLTIYEKT
jgi:hypothetical protein